MTRPLDILVFSPHPDDAELLCGGLLLLAKQAGMRTGVIDFTRGELGTRGSVAERKRETAAATKLLKLDVRENFGFRDGHLNEEKRMQLAMVRALRKYRPSLLLVPHWEDQHPDHEAVGRAALHAAFLAGVAKYDPRSGGGVANANELPYRPRQILHFNNRYGIDADVVINVSGVFEEKLELVKCYKTQFGAWEGSKEKLQTRLSHSKFFEILRGMHAFYGYKIGVDYGEAYCVKTPIRVDEVAALRGRET